MNSLSSALSAALARAKQLNSGTLTYLSGSTTLSATVYKSFLKDYNRDMDDAGYSETYDNLYVMATPADVSSWGLQPMTSVVKLDGVEYMIGKTINKTTDYWTVWLRIKK
jgi:hypothetical protein